jgi:hypothetical protein
LREREYATNEVANTTGGATIPTGILFSKSKSVDIKMKSIVLYI